MKDGLKKALPELVEWILTAGPILVAIGLLKKEGDDKNGKPIYAPTDKLSKAGTNLLGLGKDDEALFAVVLSRLNDGDAEKITSWLISLKPFQQKQFRLSIVQLFNEFKELDAEKKPEAINYGLHIIDMINSFSTDELRTQACITIGIISKKPPLVEQAWKKIKKSSGKKICKKSAAALRKINDNLGF